MKKLKSVLDATEIKNFRKNEKAIITKVDQKLLEHSTVRQPLTLDIPALSPNQIWSLSNEMLIKRFDKLLETLLKVQWIITSSVDLSAK